MVNLLRKGGGQFAPENNQNGPCLEVVNLLRNQVVNLTGFSNIMEPYRPFVDRVVLGIVEEGLLNEILTPELKKRLLMIPVLDLFIDDQKSPLMIAMQRTTASLYGCFLGEQRKIIYPTVD